MNDLIHFQLVFNRATGELVSINQFEEQDQATSALPDYDKLLNAYHGIIPDAELDAQNLESTMAYSRFYPTLDSDDDQEAVATIGSITQLQNSTPSAQPHP